MRLSLLSTLATTALLFTVQLVKASEISEAPKPTSSPTIVKRDDGLYTAKDIPVFAYITLLGSPASKEIEPPASLTETSSSTTSTGYSTINSYGKVIPTAIVFSPYSDNGGCKSSDTIYQDLSVIKSVGITKIRMYGTDCNTINSVLNNAKILGLKVNQGFWMSSNGYSDITGYVDDLISWANTNGWGIFDFITVGNEVINSGFMNVATLMDIIADVKARLRAGGYTGPITTSEPPVTYENNPQLCTDSAIDIVGINPHSYFDPYSSAASSGTFVLGQYNIVKGICGNKEVLVTETGYPSVGIQNGNNIPSLANQEIAVEAILHEMESKATILSLYNDFWKDPGPYGIEQYFGTLRLYQA